MKWIWIAILALLLNCFPNISYCAVEDFTTYTEVDEGNDITITATKCAVSSMRKDANSSVYKDFNAAHFGNFDHDFDWIVTAEVGGANTCGSYHISNTSAATITTLASANIGVSAYFADDSGSRNFYLRQYTDDDTDTYSGALNTQYYCTCERTATTVKLYIYSDSGRETLVDTLTVTHDGTTYQYIGPVHSADIDFGGTEVVTYDVENLDLQEAEAPPAGQVIMFY